MTITYYARADYTYTGGDKNFSIPFSYINQNHIIVIKNETETIINFEFLSENQIQINDELSSGDVISIRRLTPLVERMVTFTDDNILDEESLNLSNQQLFNAMQEVEDREGAFEINTTNSINSQIATSTTNLTTYIVQNVYEAKSEIAASAYTKAEADVTFATLVQFQTLNNAYNTTLSSIQQALDGILYGSTTINEQIHNTSTEIVYVPDYTNIISITLPYTTVTGGYVLAEIFSEEHFYSCLFVNNIEVGKDFQLNGDRRAGTHSYKTLVPVNKGDVITATGQVSAYFIARKEATE